jgi:predicted aspartyl protease
MPHEHSEHAQTLGMPKRPQPAKTQIAASTSHRSGKIPLVLLNNDPSQKFVRVVLKGDYTSKEVLMLVDTGAQRTLLDDKLAKELDIEHVQDAMLSGITGSAKGWIGRLGSLRIGQEEVEDLYVMVAPVSGRLLLGMDVLERLSLAVSPRSLDRVQ